MTSNSDSNSGVVSANRSRRPASASRKQVRNMPSDSFSRGRRTVPLKNSRRDTSTKNKRQSVSAKGKRSRKDPLLHSSERAREDVPCDALRVGDIRAKERARRNRIRYRRYILRIIIVIVLILAVFFGAIFVYRSDVLSIKNVKVRGASHLSDSEITKIAAIPADSTLLRLDVAGIKSRLEDNAWVADVAVNRQFPDTIIITITEHSPGAAVKINDKSIWVISQDGVWLSAATAQDWKDEMHIVDVDASLSAPVAGQACKDGGISNALKIIKRISNKLKKKIKSISAESSVKTSLNLKNGITVAFGDSSQIKLKEADIWALVKKYKTTLSYINVRVPERPTYRTID